MLLDTAGQQLGKAAVPDTFAFYRWSPEGSFISCSCHHVGLVSVHISSTLGSQVRVCTTTSLCPAARRLFHWLV